ncbi:hypothetical protein PAHAL_2G252500 [Panicum hallii]|jgi:hypothetical protein|uniref:Uncharacterized protein n=1 Tax=Panicum hallii TaxID=206008 RepID=A0A2T8KQD7_9POAL|nr:hypothetical protein PAHAL_2G252500 [Panicum hallii]
MFIYCPIVPVYKMCTNEWSNKSLSTCFTAIVQVAIYVCSRPQVPPYPTIVLWLLIIMSIESLYSNSPEQHMTGKKRDACLTKSID